MKFQVPDKSLNSQNCPLLFADGKTLFGVKNKLKFGVNFKLNPDISIVPI